MQRLFSPPPDIELFPVARVSTREGEEKKVVAVCRWIEKVFYQGDGKKKEYGEKYVVSLHKDDFNRKYIGSMTVVVVDSPRINYLLENNYENIYRDKEGNILLLLLIKYMENETYNSSLNSYDYKNVGAALHECAFRFSLLKGCEGRILLNAVRDSHYFHYKHGFRRPFALRYYEQLAECVYQARGEHIHKDLGNITLYLPRKYIEANLLKYDIEHGLSDFSTENDEGRRNIYRMERLVDIAVQNILAWQILQLLKVPYGNRVGSPHLISSVENDEYGMPIRGVAKSSLSCYATTFLIDKTINFILDNSPFNTPEKNRSLILVLTGAMIYMMAMQDKNYGEQDLYENSLLYPQASVDDLLASVGNFHTGSHGERFAAIGMRALIEKSIPFSVEMCQRFFPALKDYPALTTMLAQVALPDEPDKDDVSTLACSPSMRP